MSATDLVISVTNYGLGSKDSFRKSFFILKTTTASDQYETNKKCSENKITLFINIIASFHGHPLKKRSPCIDSTPSSDKSSFIKNNEKNSSI